MWMQTKAEMKVNAKMLMRLKVGKNRQEEAVDAGHGVADGGVDQDGGGFNSSTSAKFDASD